MKIDVMIMGSSRPQLLKYTVESFRKNVVDISNSTFKYYLHEDFVFEKQSRKSIRYALDSGIFPVESFPKVGVGRAMDFMFHKYIKSDYLFYLQDDWEFERPVELDRLLFTMKRYPAINCVTFNKYRNMKPGHHQSGFADKDYYFDGMPMTIYPGWQFLPGIWRMSKVREKWRVRENRPEGYYQNAFGTHEQRSNRKFCEKNIGAYMYGPIGDYRYVRHIGSTWRMAEWQLKNGRPVGGLKHWDFQSVERDRAPWLPDLQKRPMNPDVKLTAQGKKILETKPDHIKKIYSD